MRRAEATPFCAEESAQASMIAALIVDQPGCSADSAGSEATSEPALSQQ